ncbi:aspartic proteinase CDR1-like [Capsicum chacoense]
MPILVLLSFFHLSLVSSHRSVNGFTLDLIHRDSPLSPFHNPSNTPYERLQNAFDRSFSRASFLKEKCDNSIQSTVIPRGVEYIMKISIGTPPIDTHLIVDTGSDLSWTQCEPCIKCFKQLTPIFNPKKSSSYKTLGCNNKLCQDGEFFQTCTNNTCNYNATYGDLSHTTGYLSTETFKFASTSGEHVSIPNIAFGCGHDNGGLFTNASSGVIGLGCGNAISVVNQMNQEIKGKFSYCMIPLESLSINSNATSHISFGDNAVVSGPGVVSTPLFKQKLSMYTFYYLNLKGVSIGNKTLEFKSSKISPTVGDGGNDQGNIIIDSGTLLTFLPQDFYESFESRLKSLISAPKKVDPSGTDRLCYESDENGTIDLPKIVAHFTDADIELLPSNTFPQVKEGLVCLAILPSYDFFGQPAIFGNLAQANFLIGYDLVANKVSFKPTDCAYRH